jgi:transcriptional regulator of heat shock response
MLTLRQKLILRTIVEQYIKEPQPIASGFLVNKIKPEISSATVRNEMVALEEAGYIQQPHTSAGRIPTAKAYQLYVDELLQEKKKQSDQLQIEKVESKADMKDLARKMSKTLNEAVVVAFEDDGYYYTGISSLFGKPEFEDKELILSMSEMMDHMDSVMDQLFDEIDEFGVLIGRDNPFGASCSVVISPVEVQKKRALMAVLGPMRMDYRKNISLIDEIRKLMI